MKTNYSNPKRNHGSVLVISLSVVAVAAIVLASYFLIVQNQSSSVARSQSWNTTISVAEAGLEEGLALINKGTPANGTNGTSTCPPAVLITVAFVEAS